MTGIPATLSAIFAGVATILVALNRRRLTTPSGDPIGHVVERTHDLAAVNAAAVARIENGGGAAHRGEVAE